MSTLTDLKAHLRLPDVTDDVLDAMLTTLLTVAQEKVEGIVGSLDDLNPVPESVNLAIRFLAGHLYDHPDPSSDDIAAVMNAIMLLLSDYRKVRIPVITSNSFVEYDEGYIDYGYDNFDDDDIVGS